MVPPGHPGPSTHARDDRLFARWSVFAHCTFPIARTLGPRRPQLPPLYVSATHEHTKAVAAATALQAVSRGATSLPYPFRVSRELEHWETGAVDDELVGPDGLGREEGAGGEVGDVVVLLDAVAADAEAADEGAVAVEGGGAGEEDD